MIKEKVLNWSCDNCGKELTEVNEETEEVSHITHFDISRSRKELYIETTHYNGKKEKEIVENMENRNEKMLYNFCEKCFLLILNESKTLGKHFWIEKAKLFIY